MNAIDRNHTVSGDILVVEDNSASLRLLRDILSSAGHRVRPISSGEEALDEIGTELPELILLDICLPGMDGFDVCRQLKSDARTREVPVIFISAMGDTVDKMRAFDVGGQDFICKPYQLQEVLARVRTHLHLYQAEKALKETQDRLEERVRERTEALSESEERYRSITQLALDAIIASDERGRIIDWNRGAETIFGYGREEILGRPIEVLVPVAFRDRHRSALQGAGKSGEVKLAGKLLEMTGLHKDGHEFPLELSLSSWVSRGRTYFSAVLRDITERKRLAEHLQRAKERAEEASRAKSAFLAAMSHDIRTPMNAILGMGEVLRESGLNPEQNRVLNILTHAGESLLALINDILDLSKIEAGQLQMENVPFDLRELTRGTCHILHQKAETGGLTFQYRLQPDSPRVVVGDPQRLRQILLNLLGNAIKFTKRGGVTLTVEPVGADHVRFIVSDTGIGIKPENLDRIFNPFQQAEKFISREFGGSGLGLSICSRLVQAMNSEIEVESEEGRGSLFRFVVRLPRLEKVPAERELAHVTRTTERKKESTGPPPERVLNILLVDDAEDNRMVITAFLRKSPCRLVEVSNGEAAVKAYQSEPFDLVLMDMQMPILDGFGATKRIRDWERAQNRPRIPIIALTANAMKEDIEKAETHGCDLHLSKPVRRSHLLEVINRFGRGAAIRP